MVRPNQPVQKGMLSQPLTGNMLQHDKVVVPLQEAAELIQNHTRILP
jgi:hypothetical protein